MDSGAHPAASHAIHSTADATHRAATDRLQLHTTAGVPVAMDSEAPPTASHPIHSSADATHSVETDQLQHHTMPLQSDYMNITTAQATHQASDTRIPMPSATDLETGAPVSVPDVSRSTAAGNSDSNATAAPDACTRELHSAFPSDSGAAAAPFAAAIPPSSPAVRQSAPQDIAGSFSAPASARAALPHAPPAADQLPDFVTVAAVALNCSQPKCPPLKVVEAAAMNGTQPTATQPLRQEADAMDTESTAHLAAEIGEAAPTDQGDQVIAHIEPVSGYPEDMALDDYAY